MQQGGSPTPFDRNMGTKMAAKCVEWLNDQVKLNIKPDGTVRCESTDSACLLGIVRRQYRFTPLADLIAETNFECVKFIQRFYSQLCCSYIYFLTIPLQATHPQDTMVAEIASTIENSSQT